MMNISKLLTVALLCGIFSLAGCEKGPAEKAGETVDHAVDKTKDAMATDGAMENTGEKVDEAINTMKEGDAEKK